MHIKGNRLVTCLDLISLGTHGPESRFAFQISSIHSDMHQDFNFIWQDYRWHAWLGKKTLLYHWLVKPTTAGNNDSLPRPGVKPPCAKTGSVAWLSADFSCQRTSNRYRSWSAVFHSGDDSVLSPSKFCSSWGCKLCLQFWIFPQS